MSLYLDTSLLVAAFTLEEGTDKAQQWLAAADPETLHISEWTVAEFSSALSLKLRTEQIDIAQRTRILSAFRARVAGSFTIIDIDARHFRAATGFVERHKLNLRAADALHLAVAADYGLTLCTLDRRLAAAGPILGVATELAVP